ncbi:hypothetical protein PENTCL1PPCAC_19477, partial [Pristionchus entomophagus]
SIPDSMFEEVHPLILAHMASKKYSAINATYLHAEVLQVIYKKDTHSVKVFHSVCNLGTRTSPVKMCNLSISASLDGIEWKDFRSVSIRSGCFAESDATSTLDMATHQLTCRAMKSSGILRIQCASLWSWLERLEMTRTHCCLYLLKSIRKMRKCTLSPLLLLLPLWPTLLSLLRMNSMMDLLSIIKKWTRESHSSKTSHLESFHPTMMTRRISNEKKDYST